MAKTVQDPFISRLFPFVRSERVLAAIRSYFATRMEDLDSEMNRRMAEKKETVDEIASLLGQLNPRVGSVLTLAQFEDYVVLQRRLMDAMKEVPDTKNTIREEFDAMLNDSRKQYFPTGFYMLMTEPLFMESRSEVAVPATLLRSIQMEAAIEATCYYFLHRQQILDSEVDQKMKAVGETSSKIASMEPRVGNAMTIAQFEEYVVLQRRFLEEVKGVFNAEAEIGKELQTMLDDVRKRWVPEDYYKLIGEPSLVLKTNEKKMLFGADMLLEVASSLSLLVIFYIGAFAIPGEVTVPK